jgi:hypothetical protein
MDTKRLTDERGSKYGPPEKHFSCTQGLYGEWLRRRNDAIETGGNCLNESAMRHAVYMILDKLSRAANDPTHLDNWDDVAGYAACAKRVVSIDNNGQKPE